MSVEEERLWIIFTRMKQKVNTLDTLRAKINSARQQNVFIQALLCRAKTVPRDKGLATEQHFMQKRER